MASFRTWLPLILLVTPARADKPLVVGDPVGETRFKDIRYLNRSLSDFKERKAFVLVFTTTSCPVAQRYWPALNRMEADYRDKGVQFLALNVAADESIRGLAAHAVRHEVAMPVVKDEKAALAKRLGVERVPTVVVLDAGKKLRYRGRIDDQYRPGGALPAPTRRDLQLALDAVLAGKPVETAETTADGCLITREEVKPSSEKVTYAEDVAPILRKHCVDCHRPGTAAPFALTTYEQVKAKANMIAEAVRDERMPPWYAAPEHKEFVNQRSLTVAERETVRRWVEGGKERGDVSRLPALKLPEPNAWQIGEPNLVVESARHELPAEGLIPYKYVLLPHVFTSDTWVQGVQIRPDNPRVLHHCNMAYVSLGESFKISNFITGFVPGGDALTLDDKVGFRIPKGSMLILQAHYVTTGKPEACQIKVGFRYASGEIERQLRFEYLATHRYSIPPGAPAYRISTSRILEREAEGVGLFAHMHVRGRDMTFVAHYPGGKSETLLLIPNYHFDWQMPYRWAKGGKTLPKGTRLECIAHYDNSAFNPYNPDPTATVKDGQQTHQEMLNGFVFYVDAKERLGLVIDGKTGKVR